MYDDEYLSNSFEKDSIIPSKLIGKEEIYYSKLKLIAYRIAMITFFLLGLFIAIMGSILLGIHIYAPAETFSTEVIGASKLKLPNNGIPNAYCEVDIGTNIFLTNTIWDTSNPNWFSTFTL